MTNIIIWIISLIVFSWCFSNIILSLIFFKTVPQLKISLIIYLIITILLYIISYCLLSKYFTDIVICSIIAFIIALVTPKRI